MQLRMIRMFCITIWQKYMADFDNEEALQNLMDLADSPVMLAELIDLLQYRYDQIDLVDEPMDIGFDCPLDVHCTYTARQILTAFDDEKVMSFREGVKWLPAKNTDVFFITLNKSDKDYLPTTISIRPEGKYQEIFTAHRNIVGAYTNMSDKTLAKDNKILDGFKWVEKAFDYANEHDIHKDYKDLNDKADKLIRIVKDEKFVKRLSEETRSECQRALKNIAEKREIWAEKSMLRE